MQSKSCTAPSLPAASVLCSMTCTARMEHFWRTLSPGSGSAADSLPASALQVAIMKPCDEEPLAPNNPKVSMQVAAAPCQVGLLPEHCRPVHTVGWSP